MSAGRRGAASSVVEGTLGGLARLLLRGPWPPNGRIVVKGVFGFLMQMVRSRALGLPRRSPGAAEAAGGRGAP